LKQKACFAHYITMGPEGKAAIAGGRGFSAGLKLVKHFKPLVRHLLDAELEAVRRFAPDMIIYHPESLASPFIASALNCPSILASPLPGFTPTSALEPGPWCLASLKS
jgi:sterol 3beta-glucosyltransferase